MNININNEQVRRVIKYTIMVLATGLISGLLYNDVYLAVIMSCIVGTVYVLLDMHMPTAVVTVK